MADLADREFSPRKPGEPALPADEASALLAELQEGWAIADGKLLRRTYTFSSFARALAFVNEVGAAAEAMDHHPDLHLSWGKVTMETWTHTVGGLSDGDFILAAKADRAYVPG
jgi:4a-hydroxytetrahydrobiopterin dehydratase